MPNKMLIDASHPEETRVVVVHGNRIEEFDFESQDKKQLKGNIYLARVTRVEPSLQAAFVEYGGNRHGFLAFSEIHPDYYQIPVADRQALLKAEAEAAADEAEEARNEERGRGRRRRRSRGRGRNGDDATAEAGAEGREREGDAGEDGSPVAEAAEDAAPSSETADPSSDETGSEGGVIAAAVDADVVSEPYGDSPADADVAAAAEEAGDNGGSSEEGTGDEGEIESLGAGDAIEEAQARRRPVRRQYKIQEVIKRRQILLVQVVKEERGNKGAALTTYLSLAGRYCVLMPNTMHGGGISRKISNGADRRKLKAMIDELALPPTMGCIVRTAGMSRTKVEIKRDFDYLARLWDEIREKTLESSAPALVHSDSDLVKRAIRDIYHKDIEEVLVEGDEGYKAAKQFMKLLMPSHARRVKQYADPVSLYQRYGVEDQLAGMLNPVVQLKSGGYLVINPTEALVSIDINSGRSTREHNIEQTAVSTNLEAAAEIARQLRLRDMAGLIVIDFIDMDHGSNVRKVERAMKDALKNDRARIQVGRISGFGLMEMSRQRLRTGVLEASTRPCPHCEGTGLVRTASSAGLSALRLIEEEAARGKGSRITLRASQEATFYLLNEKRRELRDIEELYGVTVEILPDGETEGARMAVEVTGPPPTQRRSFAPIAPIEDDDDDIPEDEDEDVIEAEAAEDRRPRERTREEGDGDTDGEGRKRRRRRRRGRRGRRDEEGNEIAEGGEATDSQDAEADTDADAAPEGAGETVDAEAAEAKPRRRRGGRGRKKADASDATDDGAAADDVEPVADAVAAEPVADEAPAAEEKPKRKRAPRKTKAAAEAEAEASETAETAEATAPVETTVAAAEVEAEPAKPAPKKRASRAKKAVAAEAAPEAVATGEAEPVAADRDAGGTGPDGEPRRGWWQRTFGN